MAISKVTWLIFETKLFSEHYPYLGLLVLKASVGRVTCQYFCFFKTFHPGNINFKLSKLFWNDRSVSYQYANTCNSWPIRHWQSTDTPPGPVSCMVDLVYCNGQMQNWHCHNSSFDPCWSILRAFKNWGSSFTFWDIFLRIQN